MAEHWCKEHQQTFFKKGAMKGYAHPILDENGEKTGQWCNEPKSEVESKPEPPRSGSTNDSIEAQVAFKGMIELIVADKIKVNDPTGIATMSWAIRRLGGKDVSNKVSTKDDRVVSGEGPGLGKFDEEGMKTALNRVHFTQKGVTVWLNQMFGIKKTENPTDMIRQLNEKQLEVLLAEIKSREGEE